MSYNRLKFKQRKFILTCFYKFESMEKVERRLRKQFHRNLHIILSISRIRDKFEVDGTVKNAHRKFSARQGSSSMEEELLETLGKNHKKSV